jgi:hypothetical protein
LLQEMNFRIPQLGGEQALTFMFDELGTQANDYYYQVVYCNADWTVSDLFTDEFLEGFPENHISDYHFSVNTTVPYINYQVTLPNEDVKFKISGNYLFRIFENQNRDSILLTKRFVVFEPMVKIEADVSRPLGDEMHEKGQEINLKVYHDDFPIADPYSEVKVFISQNNRTDKTMADLKPVFIRDKELDYRLPGQYVFTGGNEFRMFSFQDKNRFGMNVNDVQYRDTIYHVQLRLDESRKIKKYFWEEDLNGKYLVNLANSYDANESADYAYVYFYLIMDEPIIDGSVYVMGDFCQWKRTSSTKMTYNFDHKYYEAVMLLKQGFYNYGYTTEDNFTHQTNEMRLEGAHYETENDYLIYVYHRGFGQKYDRLVGYQVINSKYRN